MPAWLGEQMTWALTVAGHDGGSANLCPSATQVPFRSLDRVTRDGRVNLSDSCPETESKMSGGQAPPGVVWSGRLDGLQGDLVAQPLKLADQLPLVVLGGLALLEVVVAHSW